MNTYNIIINHFSNNLFKSVVDLIENMGDYINEKDKELWDVYNDGIMEGELKDNDNIEDIERYVDGILLELRKNMINYLSRNIKK